LRHRGANQTEIEIALEEPEPGQILDERVHHLLYLADSAHPEATVYATAGTKSLASGTEARTVEPADGIASGMPTN
jgi:hypothetical protein